MASLAESACRLRNVAPSVCLSKGTRLRHSSSKAKPRRRPLVILGRRIGRLGQLVARCAERNRSDTKHSENRRAFRLIAIPLGQSGGQLVCNSRPWVSPIERMPNRTCSGDGLAVMRPTRWWLPAKISDSFRPCLKTPLQVSARFLRSRVEPTARIAERPFRFRCRYLRRIPKSKRRQERSPRQLADELAQVYGHDFDQLTYLPGMALIGQLRLGQHRGGRRLAERYLDGRDNLARANSLTLAGHLVFAELAEGLGIPAISSSFARRRIRDSPARAR